ncbi:MAG: hypothetical protein J2P17_18950 [Mycobacterium sp.]|nr:hypothetical protein [Mycobacterium sp.]
MLTPTSLAGAHEALHRLRRSGLDPYGYLYEVSVLIRRIVPHDVSGWMTLDPDTMLSGGTVIEANKSRDLDRALWRNELLDDSDVYKLADLATRPTPVVALSELDAAAAAESPRIQRILRPAGIGHGLRVMVRIGGSSWGHGAIYRELGSRDFDADEKSFLTDAAGEIAEGLRRSLSCRPSPGADVLVPGVVVFDVAGRVLSTTAPANRLIALIPGAATSALYAVAIAAGRRDDASARVRLIDGRWLLVQGGRMHGAFGEPVQVAVTLLPAPPADLTSVLLRLHRLSARERQVAELLMRGPRTEDIAAQLHISYHTLRDHVKAVLTKVGARSRSELMALVSDYVSPNPSAPTDSLIRTG